LVLRTGKTLKKNPNISVRLGFFDFVPQEDRCLKFASKYHPALSDLTKLFRESGIETLLDHSRLLVLSELVELASSETHGDLIELGVYKGGSAAVAGWKLRRAHRERTVHLCDTFAGMSDTLDWEFHEKGDFADTSLEAVAARLAGVLPAFPFRFHRGLFSETLPTLVDQRFCFAHVDADLYQSVREACEFVYPRIAKGGIILFDDYGASTCPGAKKAIDEFFSDKLEKPTHVSSVAYAVRIGSPSTDFHRIVRSRTLGKGLLRAALLAPRRVAGQALRYVTERLASPKATKILAMPLLPRSSRSTKLEPGVADARSILVVRLDTIGDLVLMSPFLRELRRSSPSAWITLVIDPRFANLVELCPHVNEVVKFDPHYYGRRGRLELHRRALALARDRLWPRKFDLALLPRWDVDYYHSAFVAYFSRAGSRIGYSERTLPSKEQLNRDFDCLFTRTLDDRTSKHEVERNLAFLRNVGGAVIDDGLELWLSDEDRESAQHALLSRGIGTNDVLVGIGVGAGHPRRIWPLKRFIEFGHFLKDKFGARILIFGGLEDRDEALRLQVELGNAAINFAGETTLRQTAAFLQHTKLMVANDSGPMHIAAAAGSSVVELSCHPTAGDVLHANSPARFHPWNKNHVVLQPRKASGPCTRSCEWHGAHCILGVSVNAVSEAATALLTSAH
jgi:heptosyltransferase-2